MKLGPLKVPDRDRLRPSGIRVALLLARPIESIQSDPEQLRSGIYELARQKLQQLSEDDPAEKIGLMHALEVATAGVEGHMKGAATEKFPVSSAAALVPGARPEAVAAVGAGAAAAGQRNRYTWGR